MLEQEFDHVGLAVLRGGMQRRELALLPGIDVGAVLEQLPRNLEVAAGDRGVQRLDAHGVVGDLARVRALVEEPGRDVRMPEERRQAKRREAVAGERVQQLRVVAERLLNGVQTAERGGREHIELRARIGQLFGDRGLAVVRGHPHDRHTLWRLRVDDRRVGFDQSAHGIKVTGLHGVDEEIDGHR